MEKEKTVLQNFLDRYEKTQTSLSAETDTHQGTISKDLKSNNGLKMCMKYASKLGMSEFEFKGMEHGCYIEGTAKVKNK